jgi:hypothetical protein
MAARNVKIRHDEETRAKIQTSQLLNRLQDHVFGKCELTPTQVRAAEICLRKTIPDLTATEMTAEVVHRFAQVPAVMSKADWLATRGDPKLLELKPAEPEKPKDPNSKLN